MQNTEQIIMLARSLFDTEAQAILNLKTHIGNDFIKACKLLLACEGRIIVTGIGKSGHVGNKIAATFASTGSPAFFMHPTEASHGDIGSITKKDVVLALSNSGNAQEILAILPIIKILGVPLISITGNPNSNLAKAADVSLDVSIEKEACTLGLVPTTSTAVTMAMGDALAVALIELRGFTAEDFARSHPGGILGKRLLLRVDDLMRKTDAIPRINIDSFLSEALIEMSKKRMGMTTVINADGTLAGIFTDGDLRRILDRNLDIRTTNVASVMTTNCKTITLGTLAIEAIQFMEQHQVTALIVADQNNVPIGAIHMHDLLKSGLI